MRTVSINDLKKVENFEDLPDDVLQWVIDNTELHEVEPGALIIQHGEPVDYMHILLEGKVEYAFSLGGQRIASPPITKGVSGALPYSRLKNGTGNLQAIAPTAYLAMHKEKFREMEKVSSDLVARLVGLMINRTRESTRNQQQREKMMALGKLSAGLAHELNNPAAAIVRAVKSLHDRIADLPKNLGRIIGEERFTEEQRKAFQGLMGKASAGAGSKMSVVERSEMEDEVGFWLEDAGIEEPDPFELANTFVDTGLTVDDLETFSGVMPEEEMAGSLTMLENLLDATRLLAEISDASGRISELVGSVKSYSHMDKAPAKEKTDIREGITSTVTMLGHKFKKKNIALKLEFPDELAPVLALAGELNQVWTNIIDNALDALSPEGQIRVFVREEGDFVKTAIIDNGPGIPPDIQSRIFEPFFTTKKMGKGTGLGLDIVQRIIKNHNADIRFESEPGHTEFEVCIPKASYEEAQKA